MHAWFRRDAAGAVTICVHVQPGARRTEVAGLHGDRVKIRVAAPALEDRANEALVDYLAQQFEVPRRSVKLVTGAKSREKRLEVRGSTLSPAAALGIPD